MAYTICDRYGEPKELRILQVKADGSIKAGEPFVPFWWVCDPCNPSRSRYEITFRDGVEPSKYRWFEIITTDDSAADVVMKIEHYRKVLAADAALEAARREYERLNG